MIWHVLTPEYPPESGGVAHYTSLLGQTLSDPANEVHVWCPRTGGLAPETAGVTVHHDLGAVTPADLVRTGAALDRFPTPRHLLVQWVPHGYGYRSMNLPFCFWVWARSVLHGDHVEIMAHEAFLSFGEGTWRQDAAALVHRLMTVMLLLATRRVWVSDPVIEKLWKPYTLGRAVTFGWLPVPSNVPVTATPAAIAALRRQYLHDGQILVGHFGSFNRQIAPFLDRILPVFLRTCSNAALLLIGPSGDTYCATLLRKYPEFAGRVHTTGYLELEQLSSHLSACDLMIQPYPDGVTTRRGTIMAALAHGLPIVTTTGGHTQDFWSTCGAVTLAPEEDTQTFVEAARNLIGDEAARTRMGACARSVYEQRFDIRHTVAALRRTAGANASRPASTRLPQTF